MKWQTQELYFRQLLASMIGIPLLGKIWFVVPAGSSTSLYEEWARRDLDIPAELIHAGNDGLANAYANAVANRNDVICVFPGAYDLTASLDWTKDNLHLIGLGGPNTRSDYSEKNVVIYTDTTGIDWTIHLTGDHCVFKNIGINNAGANAGNYGPLYVNGYGNYFENVSLIGNMQSQQLADDDCASLHIGTNAHNCKWINCDIGEDCWGKRSAAKSGQVSFIGSNPNGGLFRNCFFRSQSETATVAMITVYKGAAGTTHIGRGWVFDSCIFNNWDGRSGEGTNCNQVFELDASSGHQTAWPILLHRCSAYGYDRWTDYENVHIKGTMPIADDGGGLSITLDQTVAGGT